MGLPRASWNEGVFTMNFSKKSKFVLSSLLLTIALLVFTSCSGCYMVKRYINIDKESQERVIAVINDFYGTETGKITKINKIVHQWLRDSEIFVFAEVNWPELWSNFPWRIDSSSEEYILLGHHEVKNLGNGFDNFTL